MVLTLRKALKRLYAARLRQQIVDAGTMPTHIGLIMDGNRRWARQNGFGNASIGHRYGAEHLEDLLRWVIRLGISNVTVFVCSTENLTRRQGPEVAFLMHVIEDIAHRLVDRRHEGWRVQIAGNLDILPPSTATALTEAVEATSNTGTDRFLTLAIGYGGRQEIVDALRGYLYDHVMTGMTLAQMAQSLDIDDISRYMYAPDLPVVDLIIRTSGEQRSSDFLLWQGVTAAYFFCDAYWPAFREVDLLRAIRSCAARRDNAAPEPDTQTPIKQQRWSADATLKP